MPSASLFMFLYLVSVLNRFLLVNAMGHKNVLSDASSHGYFIPSLTCCSPVSRPTPDASVSKYSCFVIV